jgi:hypothetical protein
MCTRANRRCGYILAESQIVHDGLAKLGPIGSRVVAEVICRNSGTITLRNRVP